jgi:hypothetical protein
MVGRVLAVLACVALLVTGVRAQETTASIVGVVRDAGGGVIPGASVTAAHDGGLAVYAATDGSGRFRFPALPPGVFAVTAFLSGFAPARVEGIDLHLGQRLDVPITLEQATLSESIRVVAESPTIAITQSARTTSLRADEIENLPNGRDFTDVVGQVSGANPEPDRFYGLLSIDGSSASENRFIVDGAELTDITYGPPGRGFVTDFMDEIQVKSSGYAPEYGGSTGGVINAITKSGTNTWHGDALLYWEADWLDAGNRSTLQLNPEDSTLAEYVTYPKDDYRALEPGFTLGGPLVRDRLWLFAGYIPRFHPTRRTAPFSDGTIGTLRQDRTSHNVAVSVTGQPASSWRFRASYSLGNNTSEGRLQNQDGTSSVDSVFDDGFVLPNWSLSGSVDWIASPAVYTSLRAAYSYGDLYTTNVYEGDRMRWQTSSIGLPGVPPEYQQPSGTQNTPTNSARDREKRGRLAVQWDSTFFLTGAGRHQLKAGIQIDRRSLDVLGGQTGNVSLLYWDQSFAGERGPFGYYRIISNSIFPNRGALTLGETSVTGLGLFVQDAWTVSDRLTLNLGLRTENEDLPSFSRDPSIPTTAITFGFGDKLAPRLGFAWDATGDGRTKVYGSWGVFYDIMKLLMPLAWGGGYSAYSWYTLDSPDVSQIQDNPACPPECPGRLIQHVNFDGSPISVPDTVDPGLEPMRLQEAVIGVEREIASNLSVNVRYVHKQLDRSVEDVGYLDEEGQLSFGVANPGFGRVASFVPYGETAAIAYPRSRRDYDAVEVALQKRMADGWSGRFSYLWSRLYGNDSGLANSDFSSIAPNVNNSFDAPMMSFDENAQPVYGLLGTDRTHQIKAQLVYDFRFGTTLGASWFGASGLPLTRQAGFIGGEGFPFPFPVFYAGRESDGRMPFASRLDLQLQHRIRLSARTQLTLTATVFNAFNQGAPTDAWRDELFGGQAIYTTEADFFQGFDTQQLIAEQDLARDPRFLLDSAFQAPRTIRLAIRFSF